MANFFDQFDGATESAGQDGPTRITVHPLPRKPLDLDPRSRELAIRTVLGEAADEPEEGQAAVAAVIRNRLESGKFGKSVPHIVTAPKQFEPWGSQDGRTRMFSYAEDSEPYRRAAAAVDAAFQQGADPTGGAVNFYNPELNAKLAAERGDRRAVPAWDDGTGQRIGRHAFFGGQRAAAPAKPAGNFFDQFDAPAAAPEVVPTAAAAVKARFVTDGAAPQDPKALQAGLEQRRSAMVTGERVAPGVSMAADFANQQAAAGQRTTPVISAQMPNLVSTEVHQNDAGEVVYRDPQTGKMEPTDQNRHVVLRDPTDNTLKVFARTANTDEGMLSAAGRLIGTGAAAGAVVARPAIGAASAAKVQPRASDIFATAKPHYREFDRIADAIEMGPETASAFGLRIRAALDKANLTEDLAKAVYSATSILERGEKTSLSALQDVKRVIDRSLKSPDPNVRDAAMVANREIRKIVAEVSPEAGQAWKTADEIHSSASKVQELQRKEAVAGLQAGRAGYGGNAVNAMRQNLAPIVKKAVEGKVTGFKPDEIEAMRQIVEGTTSTNAARLVGQLSPTSGLGVIKSAGAGGTAMAAGASGVVALAIPALGMASNKLATVLTGKQIDRLKELVAKRSPAYAEAVERAVARYEKAQMELVNNPSAGKLAAYTVASRALAAGLGRDGITIGSGDLMRALQGPVKSAAEDE